MAILKFLLGNPNISVTSMLPFNDCLILIRFEIFLVLSMMSDYRLKSRHFPKSLQF